nr:circumsporozoite protein-like [Ipomoea trifida]
MEPSGDKEGDTPRRERGCSGEYNQLEKERHEELSSPAAHIAPPGGDTVDEPNNLAIKHGASPERAGHKSGEREADEEPDGDEAGRGGDEGDGENDGRGEEVEESAAVSWADEVADEAHGEPREYAAGNGGDAGVSDVAPRQVEVVPDDGDEGSGGEGGDEAGEERHPRKVERPHVGLSEREDFYGFCLVLRIHRQVKAGGGFIAGTDKDVGVFIVLRK